MPEEFSIDPSTKVYALLEHYPALEEVLIEMAPPFKKLKNPLLRKSVAKVASLRQAAVVARLPLLEMINALRAAVGEEPLAAEEVGDTASYLESEPEWFDEAKIIVSIDERNEEHEDVMPLTVVLKAASRAQPGEIVALTTDFLPAPGIDLMKRKGYNVWSIQEGPDLFRTFFAKPA